MYSFGYNFRLPCSWKKFLVFVRTLNNQIGIFPWAALRFLTVDSSLSKAHGFSFKLNSSLGGSIFTT